MNNNKEKFKIFLEIGSIPLFRFLLNKYVLKILSFIKPERLNSKSKNFFTFHLRPKYSSDIFLEVEKVENEVGIVIQGPIKKEDDFTLETIKHYAKTIKINNITLSTWEGEDIESFKKLGINIVLSKKPMTPGLMNLNYQIRSTKNGIKEALKKSKPKFILKTRTDQRIYSKNFTIFLKNLLNQFPVNKIDKVTQNYRIIGLGFNTSKYLPYSISDVFQFGETDDIKKLWSLEESDEEKSLNDVLRKKVKVKEIYEVENPEIRLIKNYLTTIGIKHNNDLKDYYSVLKNNFIIIDSESIDLYWYKYINLEYSFSTRVYKEDKLQESIRFIDWFNLYKADKIEVNNKYMERELI